jgi:endonuclease-8
VPEGDTIHKLATALAHHLNGKRLARGELRHDPSLSLAGRGVESVEALGKHLFVRLDGGLELRSHLGMTGSWHRYAPGERWKRPARQASIVLATDDDVLVCFNAREVECLRAGGVRSRRARTRLGPDLAAADEPDLDRALGLARTLLAPEAPAVDLLLDQRVACGIGTVYKSELLFLDRLHPLIPVSALDDERIRALHRRARGLLRDNLGPGARVTRTTRDGRGRLGVYERQGRPGLRCRALVETARLGHGQRSTYWCPRCQQS